MIKVWLWETNRLCITVTSRSLLSFHGATRSEPELQKSKVNLIAIARALTVYFLIIVIIISLQLRSLYCFCLALSSL